MIGRYHYDPETANDKKDFTFIIKVPGRDWVLNPGTQGSFEEWDSKLRPMLARLSSRRRGRSARGGVYSAV